MQTYLPTFEFCSAYMQTWDLPTLFLSVCIYAELDPTYVVFVRLHICTPKTYLAFLWRSAYMHFLDHRA